jgi:hypothetical protein
VTYRAPTGSQMVYPGPTKFGGRTAKERWAQAHTSSRGRHAPLLNTTVAHCLIRLGLRTTKVGQNKLCQFVSNAPLDLQCRMPRQEAKDIFNQVCKTGKKLRYTMVFLKFIRFSMVSRLQVAD